MKESAALIFDFIRQDLIIGFAIYSILYSAIHLRNRNKKIYPNFDDSAIAVVTALGFIYAFNWVVLVLAAYFDDHFSVHLLIQPSLWILLAILLRRPKLKRNILLRVIYSTSFIFTIEIMVIMGTYFHRDYSTVYWPNDLFDNPLGIGIIGFSLVIKLLEFLTLTAIYNLFKKWNFGRK